MNVSRALSAAVLAACLVSAAAVAQDTSGTLQRNLDRPFDLVTGDLPIGEVFAKLSKATGVKFIVDEDTLDCLPYGGQTRLEVKLKGVTLRNALSPMLAPQALAWSVDDGAIRISPGEPLYRMCRQATYDELQMLGKVCSETLSGRKPGVGIHADDLILSQLRTLTGNKDLALAFQTREQKEDKLTLAEERAVKSLPCTGAQWLDALCGPHDWTWYLSDSKIIVLDRKAQVERQLQRQVSLRYKNQELSAVLVDLAHKGRLQISMDPGVLQLLPIETRNNFTLIMADTSIGQALEMISGGTGLTFNRTNEGILVGPGTLASRPPATTQAARAPFFIRVRVPGPAGTSIEMMIRGDDLPDDVRAAFEARKAKVIEDLRASLAKPAATTMPAEDD